MSRSAIISVALLCAGFALGTVAQSWQPVASAALGHEDHKLLASIVQDFNRRLSNMERELREQRESRTYVRGLVPLDPVLANLKSDQLNRHIRVSIVLTVDDVMSIDAAMAMSAVDPLIRDWLLGYLSDKAASDIEGKENLETLRQQIQAGINLILEEADYPPFVKSVLLTEITVQ